MWPDRARAAAVALVAISKESTPSLGVRLLADLRQIFGDVEALATETIIRRLHALDESTWLEIKGKPLNDRGLANRLRRSPEVTPARIFTTHGSDTSNRHGSGKM